MANEKGGLKGATEQAKTAQAALAPPIVGITKEERAAMLKGNAAAEAVEVGARRFFKPADFESGWPVIHCIPFDVLENDGRNSKFGAFKQVLCFVKTATFTMEGEAGKKVEAKVSPGEIMMMTVTAGLEAVVKAAEDKESATEMWLQVKGKKSLPGGQDMWEWSVKQGAKVPRGQHLSESTALATA